MRARTGSSRPAAHRVRQPPRRRGSALLAALALVIAGAGLISQDRLLDQAGNTAASARPLSAEEAQRLASMRQTNHDHGHAAVRVTIGEGTAAARYTGWVDWRHPMVYLGQLAPPAGSVTGDQERIVRLIQAVPGLVAVREGDPFSPDVIAAAPETGPLYPPAQPPPDGWRVRQPGADGPPGAPGEPGTVDAVLVQLLASGTEQADSAQLLADSEARWLRRDRAAGYEVDVLLGPAIPPAEPVADPADPESARDRSLAGMGGAVQYWLDRQGRLHRMEALLTEQVSLRIDLDRADQTAPPVVDALGGAAIEPRPVTEAEAEILAQLPLRNHQVAGGEVRLRLPAEDGVTVSARGWLDWRHRFAYLASYRDGAPAGLLWADGSGIATRTDLPPQAGMPPLPPPAGGGWQWSPWHERRDEQGGFDLDVLLNEALSWGAWQGEDSEPIRQVARWLRRDELAGTPVDVYEIPQPAEAELLPGQARLRYWVSRADGVLLRLEVRGRSGGFGQLDVTPAAIPPLGRAG